MNKGEQIKKLVEENSSFVSQDIGMGKITSKFIDFVSNKDILKELKIDTMFDKDKEKEKKMADLLKLIDGMLNKDPSKRL